MTTEPALPRVRFGSRRRLVLFAAVALLALAGISLAAYRWAASSAMAAADLQARQMAGTHAGLLSSELQKFRLLPLVLTEYPSVSAVLQQASTDEASALNRKLETLAGRTGAAAIYVIDASGLTVAASNWNLPTSFVGQNYGFRPYFRDALTRGAAELFALGTVSGRPGLFIARRIDGARGPIGVIVVKVEFDSLEAVWARQAGETFVADEHGVVLITSRPQWRFHTMEPLDPATMAQIRSTIQFGRLPLTRLPLERRSGHLVETRPGPAAEFREAIAPVPMDGASLRFLQPMAAAEESAKASARTIILLALVVTVLLLALLIRLAERRRMLIEGRRMLEREVEARTAELTEANRRLIAASDERAESDRRYRSAREELAQANRLSTIGQIIAGVIHEVNQPVAAIRSFADNAARFLDIEQPAKARRNLALISDLTDRVGAITGELRGFARRAAPASGPVKLKAAIDGTLLLLGDGLKATGVALTREGNEQIEVRADRLRLEQILINLIQNALDSLAGRADPKIAIRIRTARGRKVHVDIADNGPGIDPALADDLFTPFVTGRTEGLGLGLGIARDLAREFGGELRLTDPSLGGATFRLELERS